MTVSSDDNKVPYTGNGVTTVFAFSRIFYSESHIKVYLDGVLQSSGYSVSGVGTDSGYVTFTSAPANGVDVLIQRVVPYRQETEFENFDGNPSVVTEKQFDLTVMQTQQLNETLSRAITVPVGDSASDLELPSAEDRAGGVLYFDGNGNVAITTESDSASAAAAAASAASAASSASAASAAQVAAEAAAVGIKWRPQVKAATTANISLSGPQTLDGVSCVAGDRVLVKDQSTAKDNGIYIVAAGSWTRATDADTYDELVSLAVSVEQGSTLADSQWICTANSGGTLGVTSITWSPFLTDPRDGSVTYVKVDPNSIATASEIRSATASKLVDAAQLLSALRPYSSTVTASGSDAQFSGLNSSIRRIVLTVDSISTNGTGLLSLEIGDAGGLETAGYSGTVFRDGGSAAMSSSFLLTSTTVAADTYSGVITLTRGDSSTNTWCINGALSATTGPLCHVCSGSKSLSAELDRLRVVAGGNSFDAGKITCEAYYF